MQSPPQTTLSRRDLLVAGAATVTVSHASGTIARAEDASAPRGDGVGRDKPGTLPSRLSVRFAVNGTTTEVEVDTRTTLLDALREQLHLTGTKKGCDHGQCGACTVMVNGVRINACLTLAVMHEGDEVTTIEGLGGPADLHPMQAAFVRHDGYQCGYCTPGQICSSVAMLAEIEAGIPSHVTPDLTGRPEASVDELRERMSGNICRCGAYSNIIDAISDVAGRQS
ncbi:aldehyde dehydrogenase iron-sulfur subunit PaoA [Ancylobacter sp. IITR112]|uniref:aldehyde dehydrogenase iron-sulfur subunit PaoA n=1 Tax=Ancylobacter sp. IITR112 TaxID=3138073 RepID=UPI00352B5CEB